MGKLKDLTNIYETYQNIVVNEMGISEPVSTSGLPSQNMTPSPVSTVVIDKPLSQNDEECVSDGGETNADMSKGEVFKILKAGNDLMNLLQRGDVKVEPWQLSKLVKASDYICAVMGSLEYDSFEKQCSTEFNDGMNDLGNGMALVGQIKSMLSGEDLSVNEEVLKQVIFNIECLVESDKK